MRVAWIAPNGGNFTLNKLKGTGGWISSLETALLESTEDVELGIIFCHSEKLQPIVHDKVTYYPVHRPLESNVRKLYNRWFRDEEKFEDRLVLQIADYVTQFKPDVVHVWGCENFYIKVLRYINCPSVVHIQGLASSIIQYYLPNGVGVSDIASQDNILDRYILKRGNLYGYKSFVRQVATEKEMAKYITNWIGRTEWDKASAYCLAPRANYYHCDELMRTEFYENQWQYHYNGKLIIQSSISDAWYKGVDIVLRTAQTLKSLGVDFEWNVYGVTELSATVCFFAKKYNINPKDVNIRLHGYVSADVIAKGLLDSDVYVHPSYIENGCNAVQEAMCLGTPTISQCVGGVKSTLASDAGILVQSNDSSVMAFSIIQMRNKDVAEGYSTRGRSIAIKRHDRESVVKELIEIYNAIINGVH